MTDAASVRIRIPFVVTVRSGRPGGQEWLDNYRHSHAVKIAMAESSYVPVVAAIQVFDDRFHSEVRYADGSFYRRLETFDGGLASQHKVGRYIVDRLPLAATRTFRGPSRYKATLTPKHAIWSSAHPVSSLESAFRSKDFIGSNVASMTKSVESFAENLLVIDKAVWVRCGEPLLSVSSDMAEFIFDEAQSLWSHFPVPLSARKEVLRELNGTTDNSAFRPTIEVFRPDIFQKDWSDAMLSVIAFHTQIQSHVYVGQQGRGFRRAGEAFRVSGDSSALLFSLLQLADDGAWKPPAAWVHAARKSVSHAAPTSKVHDDGYRVVDVPFTLWADVRKGRNVERLWSRANAQVPVRFISTPEPFLKVRASRATSDIVYARIDGKVYRLAPEADVRDSLVVSASLDPVLGAQRPWHRNVADTLPLDAKPIADSREMIVTKLHEAAAKLVQSSVGAWIKCEEPVWEIEYSSLGTPSQLLVKEPWRVKAWTRAIPIAMKDFAIAEFERRSKGKNVLLEPDSADVLRPQDSETDVRMILVRALRQMDSRDQLLGRFDIGDDAEVAVMLAAVKASCHTYRDTQNFEGFPEMWREMRRLEISPPEDVNAIAEGFLAAP